MDSLVSRKCYIDNMPTLDIEPIQTKIVLNIIDRI